MVVVEVHLQDLSFILVDDVFNSGDLLGWVKIVEFSEVTCSSLATLTVTEREPNCFLTNPLHLRDSQLSDCLQTNF